MIVRCSDCQTSFRVPDDKIPATGTMVRCSKCHCTFWLDPREQREINEQQGIIQNQNNWTDPPDPFTPMPAKPPSSQNKKLAPLADSWLDFPVVTEETLANLNLSPQNPPQSPNNDDYQEDPFSTPPVSPAANSQINENVPQAQVPEELPTGIFHDIDLGLKEEGTEQSSPFTPPEEIDEELSFQFESSPNIPSSPPEHPSILGDAVEQKQPIASTSHSSHSSHYSPPRESISAPAKIELFLTDRKQTQRQFWYTTIPLVVKGFILLLLFVCSVWLWISLSNGNFSAKNINANILLETFLTPKTSWTFHDVKIQTFPIKGKKQRLMLVQGNIKNKSQQRQQTPKLKLLSLNPHSTTLLKSVPCCAIFNPLQLSHIRNFAHIQRLYGLYHQRYPYKRWIEINESKKFHLLWLLKSPINTIKIVPISSKKQKTTTAFLIKK